MTNKRVLAAAIVASLSVWSSFAFAQEPPDPPTEPPPQEVPVAVPVPVPESPPPLPDEAHVTAAPGKGVTFTTNDDRFSLTLRARVQIRDTAFIDSGKATNEAQIRTFRLTTHGHVLDRNTKYNVQLAFGGNDFDKDNASPIFDAWVESTHLRDLNFRVGQYFVPFDRGRTMRELALQMVDRPVVVRELSLDRDAGIMLSSQDLFGTKVLGYYAFLGNGEGRNRFGARVPGPLVVGRIVLRPWGIFDDDWEGDLAREARPRLALGVAAAYNHETSRQQSTTGAVLVLGSPSYSHGAVDAVFKYGGFSLFTEGLLRHTNTDAFRGTINGAPATEATRSAWGYVVQAGMMVTSKVELTSRLEELFAWRAATDPVLRKQADTQGTLLGGGFNVYLNGHFFKIQSDYFYIANKDLGGPQHQIRAQLDATF